jgi:quercetin 2,3-dioxygenase
MFSKHRRQFLTFSAAAAAGGVLSYKAGHLSNAWAAEKQFGPGGAAPQPGTAGFPKEIVDPSEVTGPDAVPILGRLPNARRMYGLRAGEGEKHLVGSQVMVRVTRPAETGDVFEMATFAGLSGAKMPSHAHLSSHATILVMSGDIELELDGKRWRMMRGDFANIPPGTAHGWTMHSDKSQLALFSMNDRVGAAFVAMGTPHDDPAAPPLVGDGSVPDENLAAAAAAGDFQLGKPAPAGEAVRVTNKDLPKVPGPYVIADGGGEHYGFNTFLARNTNSGGQFLFLITEGGPGFGVGPHFHARHFENFLALDGTTMGWAYGKALPLNPGDYYQAPPRNLHGFQLVGKYNRFAAFLTPGIFENFFLHFPGAGGPPGAGGLPNFSGGPPNGAGGPPNFGSGPPGAGAPPAGLQGVQPKGASGPGAFAIPPQFMRMLMMSGRGPDGYPLDVHAATHPLPPQDPFWNKLPHISMKEQQDMMMMHGMLLADMPMGSNDIAPEVLAALKFKPDPRRFV